MAYQTKSPRCLGMDPGIANTGWAVVCKSARGYRLIAAGLIKTDSKASTGDRLLTIYNVLSEVVETHAPDILAIERVYHNHNVTSSLSTGAVIGIVQLIAAQLGCCAVQEFTPQQVKAASGLGGRADKKHIQRMMCRLFKRERLNPHTADAIATALAGVLRGRLPR